MTIRDAYISNEKQLQNHSSIFFYINKSLLSATSFLSWSPLAYNTTASSDKLTCTDYVDFRKCEDIFGQFSWSKNDYDDLDVKLKVFKEDDNKEFRLVQNLTIGETDFNWFIWLRNQLVNAAENFAREENLSSLLISTTSKDLDEQPKLARKVVDVVDRVNSKIGVTLLRYNVDKPESSYAQVRLITSKKEDEIFKKLSMWNKNLKNLST